MIRFVAGDVRVTVLDAGRVWLDGGAMFGVVPRPVWERERAPDSRNRIPLALNLLLLEDGRRRILVDTGVGSKWDARGADLFGLDPLTPERLLEPVGLEPERIDLVINTHLHFDHAGGNTRRDADGRVVPAFPEARYLVQATELDTVETDHPRIRASFEDGDFRPLLAEKGRVEAVRGVHDLGSGIRLVPSPGHTPGMQRVELHGGDRPWAYLADLFPTASHMRPIWGMAYDLDPLAAATSKQRFLDEAVPGGWGVIFEHDTEVALATLEETDNGRVRARPLTQEV